MLACLKVGGGYLVLFSMHEHDDGRLDGLHEALVLAVVHVR